MGSHAHQLARRVVEPHRGGFSPTQARLLHRPLPTIFGGVASTAPIAAMDRSRCPLLDASEADVSRRVEWEEGFKALTWVTTSRTTRAGPSTFFKPNTSTQPPFKDPACPPSCPADSLRPAESTSTRRPMPRDAQRPRSSLSRFWARAEARTRDLREVGNVTYHKARGALWLMVFVRQPYSYGVFELVQRERICMSFDAVFHAYSSAWSRGWTPCA